MAIACVQAIICTILASGRFGHMLEESLQKVVAKKIQIFACGACSRARGVTDADLAQWGAKFGNPTIFVSLVEWADRIITE